MAGRVSMEPPYSFGAERNKKPPDNYRHDTGFRVATSVPCGFEDIAQIEKLRAEDYLRRGLVDFAKADFDKAIANFTEAIRRDLKNATARTAGASPTRATVTMTTPSRITPRSSKWTRTMPRRTTTGASPTRRRAKGTKRKQILRRLRDWVLPVVCGTLPSLIRREPRSLSIRPTPTIGVANTTKPSPIVTTPSDSTRIMPEHIAPAATPIVRKANTTRPSLIVMSPFDSTKYTNAYHNRAQVYYKIVNYDDHRRLHRGYQARPEDRGRVLQPRQYLQRRGRIRQSHR